MNSLCFAQLHLEQSAGQLSRPYLVHCVSCWQAASPEAGPHRADASAAGMADLDDAAMLQWLRQT